MLLVNRLLWVDDQEDFMRHSSLFISDAISEIRYCIDIEDALKEFDAWKPNLVLLDLKMPPGVWGGLYFLKRLGNKTRSTPVVVLSGAGTITQCMDALDLGAIHYVEKEKIRTELKKGIEVALTKFKSMQILDDYQRICKIERDLHEIVLSTIYAEAERLGQGDIFLKLIPRDISLKTYERRIDSGGGNQEEYLDLIDLRTIMDRNYKILTFELLDSVIKPPRREERTKWLVDLNEIRKLVAHPIREELSNEQRQRLENYETSMKKWKDMIADRKLI